MAIANFLSRKKLIKLIESNRSFRCVVPGTGFFCPYCTNLIKAHTGSEQKYIEDVVSHVMGGCSGFVSVEKSKPLPLAELDKKRLQLQVRNRVIQTPAWRIMDKENHWYCPFCASPTNVQYTGSKSDLNKFVNCIMRHLETCFQFSQHPDDFKSVEELKEIASQVNKEKALILQIKKRIKDGDQMFLQRNASGQWVCPYCLGLQKHISLATDLLIEHTAPAQMAQHLMTGCVAAAKGEKIRSMIEIEAATASYGKKEEPADRIQLNPQDTVYFDSLKSEILAIRESIEKNEELEQSLLKAKQVVKSMLPKQLPKPEGYEFWCYFNACSQVGGDFYDFMDVGEGKIGIAIGDVSGHGLDAALVMGMTKKALKLRSSQFDDPRKVLAKTNDDVFPDLPQDMFITCFYGLMVPSKHAMLISRAGHNFTLVYRAKTGAVDVLREGGMPLGMMSGNIFEKAITSTAFKFGEGDIFVQYTDGVTEAMTALKEEFGMERLIESIKKYGKYDVEYLVEKTVKEVERFRGDYPQQDDITIMAIRRKKSDED